MTTLEAHSDSVVALAVDDTDLYSGSWDNTVVVWRLTAIGRTWDRVLKSGPVTVWLTGGEGGEATTPGGRRREGRADTAPTHATVYMMPSGAALVEFDT